MCDPIPPQVEAERAQIAEACHADLAALSAHYEVEWTPRADAEAALARAVHDVAVADAAALRQCAAEAEGKLARMRGELHAAREAVEAAVHAGSERGAEAEAAAEERAARVALEGRLQQAEGSMGELQARLQAGAAVRQQAEAARAEAEQQAAAARARVLELEAGAGAARAEVEAAVVGRATLSAELVEAEHGCADYRRLIAQLSSEVRLLQPARDEAVELAASAEARYAARLAAAATAHARERSAWDERSAKLAANAAGAARTSARAAAAWRERVSKAAARVTALQEDIGLLRLAVRAEVGRATRGAEQLARELAFEASAAIAAQQAEARALRASLDAEREVAAAAAKAHAAALVRAATAAAEAVERAQVSASVAKGRAAEAAAQAEAAREADAARHAALHGASTRRLDEVESRLRSELASAVAAEARLRRELHAARSERDALSAVALPCAEARAAAAENAADKAGSEGARLQKRLAAAEEELAELRDAVDREREGAAAALREARHEAERWAREAASAAERAEGAEARTAEARAGMVDALALRSTSEGLVRKLAFELALPAEELDAALAGAQGSDFEAALMVARGARERSAVEALAAASKAAVGRVREAELAPLLTELAAAKQQAASSAALAAELQLALRERRAEAHKLASELNEAGTRERTAAAAASARLERQREQSESTEAVAAEAHAQRLHQLEQETARRVRVAVDEASAPLRSEIEVRAMACLLPHAALPFSHAPALRPYVRPWVFPTRRR